MIQNPIFGVYLLISYFLTESLKGIKNYQQRSLILQYSFAQKKNLIHFTNLNLLNTKKIYTPATKPKTLLTLQIFQQNCYWFVSEKKLCCTFSRHSAFTCWGAR